MSWRIPHPLNPNIFGLSLTDKAQYSSLAIPESLCSRFVVQAPNCFVVSSTMAADICNPKSGGRQPTHLDSYICVTAHKNIIRPRRLLLHVGQCSFHLPSKAIGTAFLRPTLRSLLNYTELSSYKPSHSISPAQRTKPFPSFSHNSANDINFNRLASNRLWSKFRTVSWLCCATKLWLPSFISSSCFCSNDLVTRRRL